MTDAPTTIEAAPEALCELGAHVHTLFTDARDHRAAVVDPVLNDCLRQRKGEYAPEEYIQLGAVKTFVNVTSTKCRAGEAWLDDVLMSVRERIFTVKPTPIPNVPGFIRDMVIKQIRDEIAQLGVPVEEAEAYVRERAVELRDITMTILKKKAAEAADRMGDKIADYMSEGGFVAAFAEFRNDLMTYPYAVFRGPDVRMKKVLRWGVSNTPEVRMEPVLTYERVSPFNFYWSKWATNPQEGDVFEVMPMTRGKLHDCINLPHFDADKVRYVLARYDTGYSEVSVAQPTRDQLMGVASTLGATGTIDVLRCMGEFEGKLLQKWGVPGIDDDELKMYPVDLWVVDGICIRALINPDPLGRKVYHVTSYEKVAGSFIGKSPPMLMKPHQEIINSAYRALRKNMGLASGPFVEVDATRLGAGQAPEEIMPHMVKLVQPDFTGNNAPVYRFHQIDSRAAELVNVITHETKQCDDATGIPAYSYGTASAGVGRTVGGLAMLMGNASKGIKKVIGHTELDVLNPTVEMTHTFIMLYDPDETLKVDAQIEARGPTGVIMREALVQRRMEALQLAAPYAQAGMIPKEGIAVLLREVFRGLDLEVDDIIPDPKKQALLNAAATNITGGQNASVTSEMGNGTVPPPEGPGQLQFTQGGMGQGTTVSAVPDGRSGATNETLSLMGA